MKTRFLKLALGIAAAAGSVLAGSMAMAGDYNGDLYAGGGLKGMRGSHVPVPAPAPVPDYEPRWYLRADVGVGFGVGMNTGESGLQYGVDDGGYSAIPGSLTTSRRTGSGDEIGHIFGAGVGYYFSPSFRMDFTGEVRSEKTATIDTNFDYLAVAPPAVAGDEVHGLSQDTTRLRSWLFMANGYYDFNRKGRFNPYIGAGLGFAVNELQRAHLTNFEICQRPTDPNCNAPIPGGSYAGAQNGKNYTYSLAASATAGVSYRVSEYTSLDFNYRYLYVGGTDLAQAINGFDSTVDIDDQHEHYLRAGLRWDIR